jgi:hypothetical protein
MDQKQSFNLNADFLGGFTSIFMKLVFVIIAVYIIVLVLNFLRDKFINKVTDTKSDNISDLLIILNKLFFFSGFGFIIGNIVQNLFSKMSNHNSSFGSMNFRGEWDYLTFGIILIFIGIGFKVGNKVLKKDRIQ